MKEYGKLSVDQIRELVAALPELKRQAQELSYEFRNMPNEKLLQTIGTDLCWADAYELSLVELIALMLVAFNKAEWITDVARQPDPQQVVLDEIKSSDDWAEAEISPAQFQFVVGLLTALLRNFESIKLHNRTLSALVSEVREGNDDSLFKAVSIDRSIVACEPVAVRISRAELVGDDTFFVKLGKALQGPSKKYSRYLDDIRFMMYVLREMCPTQLTDAQLALLFVEELKLYHHPDSAGARKSLGKQFREAKKHPAT